MCAFNNLANGLVQHQVTCCTGLLGTPALGACFLIVTLWLKMLLAVKSEFWLPVM